MKLKPGFGALYAINISGRVAQTGSHIHLTANDLSLSKQCQTDQSSSVPAYMHDYKSLCVSVMRCEILVNT